jgi:OOP family OmpA-OmpF porin
MKFKIIILLVIFTITLLPSELFAQTQAAIEQMMNGNTDKRKAKKEKPKKEKKIKLKAELNNKEKLAKKANKELEAKEGVIVKTQEVEKEKSEKLKKEAKTEKPKKEKLVKVNAEPNTEPNTLAEVDEYSKMNYNKLRKTADKLGAQGSYYNALGFYEKALFKTKSDKKKVQMYTQLGDANFFLRDYKSAERYYHKAQSLNSKPKKYPLLNFQLANTYKALAKYDSSIVAYKTFIEKEQENKKMTWAVRKAKTELNGSKYALEYVNDEPKFRIKNAGENVNGPFTEYGPEIVDSRLFFSKINADKVVVLDDELKEKEFSKVYYAEINKDTLDLFQNFAENINESKVHVGNPSFAKDGNTVYFTKCKLTDEMQSECEIYKSVRENNVWLTAEKLNADINQPNTTNTQPQIIALGNEEILYFASNRKGGKGGKDIWYVNIDSESVFSKAKNIGYPINTVFDEVSPYYNTTTNNFYFSSNGHTSFGGLDVFTVSKDEEGEWSENVENLGFPVNSSLDDYDFVLDNTETIGYLASNRIGTTTLKSETCCDDIFAVNPSKIDLFVKGKVFVENATKRSVLETADLYLYNNETNEKLSELEYKDGKVFVTQITPEMDYKIVAIADGFQDAEISFKTEGITKSDTLEYNLFLENKDLTGYVLATVYYEFNVSKLRSDAPDSLRKVVAFMNAYPDVIIEVGSHTDSKGSDKYNLALSERRSLSVKNYLIYQQEISEKRLVNEWYGEAKPVAPNTLENGKDNPAGRDLNRRTEFKVIGYLKDEKVKE